MRRRATARPMRPVPTTPTVSEESVRPMRPGSEKSFTFWRYTIGLYLRSATSMGMRVKSATLSGA